MTQGVSIATKKDGTVYYRAGLYYKNKHISLGSYADEVTAGNAYLEALAVLGSSDQTPARGICSSATTACSIPSSPATASAPTLLPEETISLSTGTTATSAIPIS